MIVFIASASAAFFVLDAVPMGYMADRYNRSRIVGVSSLIFSVMVSLSGLAVSALMLFWARWREHRQGEHAARPRVDPCRHVSDLLRGRIAATISFVGRTVQAISPLLVEGLAILFGWRWPFLVLGLPVAVFALHSMFANRQGGQWEKQSVLDEVIVDVEPAPISMEAAFASHAITLRTVVIGFAALGFSLFTVPVLGSLYMEDHFGLNAFERGVVTAIGGFVGLLILPWLGRRLIARIGAIRARRCG